MLSSAINLCQVPGLATSLVASRDLCPHCSHLRTIAISPLSTPAPAPKEDRVHLCPVAAETLSAQTPH